MVDNVHRGLFDMRRTALKIAATTVVLLMLGTAVPSISSAEDPKPIALKAWTMMDDEAVTWSNSNGKSPNDGDQGWVEVKDFMMEDGKKYTNVLFTHPPFADFSWIQGEYPLAAYDTPRVYFRARLGFVWDDPGSTGGPQADNAQVKVSFRFKDSGGTTSGVLFEKVISYDQTIKVITFDLTAFKRSSGKLLIRVDTHGKSTSDWLAWVEMRVTGDARAIDLISKASDTDKTVWKLGNGDIHAAGEKKAFSGTDTTTFGNNPKGGAAALASFMPMIDGNRYYQPLFTHPNYNNEGWIRGEFSVSLSHADSLYLDALVGYSTGTSAYRDAIIRIERIDPDGQYQLLCTRTIMSAATSLENIIVDLTMFSNTDIKLAIIVQANGAHTEDWILWPKLVIHSGVVELYDLIASADTARWFNDAGNTPMFGQERLSKGIAEYLQSVTMMDGQVYGKEGSVLYTHPWVDGQSNGYIAGEFEITLPDIKDIDLMYTVGYTEGAKNLNNDNINGIVSFSYDTDGTPSTTTLLGNEETINSHNHIGNQLTSKQISLDGLSGQMIYLYLKVAPGANADSDWIVWTRITITASNAYNLVNKARSVYWYNDQNTQIGMDNPMQNGGGQVTTLWQEHLVDGIEYPSMVFTHPRVAGDGEIRGDYYVTLPDAPNVWLKAIVGYQDGNPVTDRANAKVGFRVLDGQNTHDEVSMIIAAESQHLDYMFADISEHKGHSVKIMPYANANGAATSDWVCWVQAIVVWGGLGYAPPEWDDVVSDTDSDGLARWTENIVAGTSSKHTDTDSDSFTDYEELGKGTKGGTLRGFGANPAIKDIFVEVDYMADDHRLTNAAIDGLIDIYRDFDILLHIDNGWLGGSSQVTHTNPLDDSDDADTMYLNDMALNRRPIFYYCIMAHYLDNAAQHYVAGYKWRDEGFTISEVLCDTTALLEGVFMHELGHCLDIIIRNSQGKEVYCTVSGCCMGLAGNGVNYCAAHYALMDLTTLNP